MKVPLLRIASVMLVTMALPAGSMTAAAAPGDVPAAAQAAKTKDGGSELGAQERNAQLVQENRELRAALEKERRRNSALTRRTRLLGRKAMAYRRQVRSLMAEVKKLKWRMSVVFGPWRRSVASTYGLGDGLLGSGLAGRGRLDNVRPVFAHKTMPFGTKVQFMYQGRTFIGECQDRGPFIAGREFDLGPRLARELGFGGVGTVKWRTITRKK